MQSLHQSVSGMRLNLPATVLQAQDGGRILEQGAQEETQEEVRELGDRTMQSMQQLVMAERGKHGKRTRRRPAFYLLRLRMMGTACLPGPPELHFIQVPSVIGSFALLVDRPRRVNDTPSTQG
jgi:hypothetical protein